MNPANHRLLLLQSVRVVTVHWPSKAETVQSTNVFPAAQCSCADNENGVKSVHWHSFWLLPFFSRQRKLLYERLICRKMRGWKLLACWKAERLSLQQLDTWSAKTDFKGVAAPIPALTPLRTRSQTATVTADTILGLQQDQFCHHP